MLDYAIWQAENLSKFSFYLDTHRFRQLSYLGCKQKLSRAVKTTSGRQLMGGHGPEADF